MSPTFRIAEKVLQAQAQHRPRVPRRPWARLPREAILDASLSHLALRVLGLLNLFANKQAWAWPSTATISMLLGVSKTSARRALRELTERGYIVTACQPGSVVRRRYLGKRRPLTPGGQPYMAGDEQPYMVGGRPYMAGEATIYGRDAAIYGRLIEPYAKNDLHPTRVDERCDPPAASDNGVEHRGGEAPPEPPSWLGGVERGSLPSTSPTPEPLEAHHPPPRGVLERLEAAVAAVGDLDDDESAVPFSVRARLAGRLRAASLGLLRHLGQVGGLLDCLSVAVLSWPTLPPPGDEAWDKSKAAWDESEEERLRQWLDEVTKRARYSVEELQAASEELYTLCSAARFLLAAAAFICSQRPTLTPGSNCAEAIKRLAAEAAGEAERLTGTQPRQSWSDACYLLADSLLTAQRVRRREGSITLHRWRISPRLTGDELAQRLPEAGPFVTALRSNGHGPHHEGGE